MKVDLIARKPHRYADRPIAVGQRYSASEKDARLFKAVNLADDAPAITPLEVVVDDEPEPAKPKKARKA
ncbi:MULTISPECIES: hypothetical protein [Hydrocarboniphaga]|uniref:Uncharacterized protein n=1 Tax=Hydrocarboniphaga effusa AP103 TaxID=1172194 RepID=I7ZDR6_9GAMM|nr:MULTISPECIES: hypothetical protein [Hydrocarboniphaga]EIT69999.1 hypothetical protein WQQ_01360 [Hydrocarboniphaga effusa AP103]EIT70186.1 hypothetical protein WQQ_03230 [Hydrocarboniphaga effusa AP103]MDZ4077184.1 hypothetical protein [Hydrocarboniphaga sp.]